MEFNDAEEENIPVDPADITLKSTESFQKFIYELFDKNGILNNLRAFLRGHIVDVLKSAETGDPPLCQKHFTQRLELTFQALNILIVEYLLSLEFSYTLSVFVSEIPLANMVFDFAKSLLQNSDYGNQELRFKDSDVWCILNYLGIKCDSEHASNITEFYRKKEKLPLLLCILKCVPMYRNPICMEEEVRSSQESLMSSDKSTSTLEDVNISSRKMYEKCRHYAFCKSCKNRVRRLKEKYRKKRTRLAENVKKYNINPSHVENFMKNVDVVEQKLMEEMFNDLKNVYEAEVEMIREEEHNKVKRSLANHTLLLQQQREELESELRVRENELEQKIQQKKQFVWALAKTLREQQEKIQNAMQLVRSETDRLADKENSLKIHLKDAEETLRKKGEEMREQITNELRILEQNLQALRQEREDINKERMELENLKRSSNSNIQLLNTNDNIEKQYKLLKDELNILKEYMGSKDQKIFIERGTITDGILNNENMSSERCDDSRVKSNQVVNDLKKQKNVNFSQSNLDEVHRDLTRDRSRTSVSECFVPPRCYGAMHTCDLIHTCNAVHTCDIIRQLQNENAHLKEIARQQGSHLETMSLGLRAQNHLTLRPRTAPARVFTLPLPRVSPSLSSSKVGGCGGAGEEARVPPALRARVLRPGEQLPFVGELRGRQPHCRRHLINQWRAAGRAHSHGPSADPNEQNPKQGTSKAVKADVTRIVDGENCNTSSNNNRATMNVAKIREKSPKSVLKEAKENLKNKDAAKSPPIAREKSPNAMLREAKLRLRKLEIEAEAVEQSYLDFRKRRVQLKDDNHELNVGNNIDTNFGNFSDEKSHPRDTFRNLPTTFNQPITNMDYDIDKYLREYQNKYDIGNVRFKNKNTTLGKVKPIPDDYSKIIEEINNETTRTINYLEKPMTDFRKFYQPPNHRTKRDENISPVPLNPQNPQVNNTNTELDSRLTNIIKLNSLSTNNTNIDSHIIDDNKLDSHSSNNTKEFHTKNNTKLDSCIPSDTKPSITELDTDNTKLNSLIANNTKYDSHITGNTKSDSHITNDINLNSQITKPVSPKAEIETEILENKIYDLESTDVIPVPVIIKEMEQDNTNNVSVSPTDNILRVEIENSMSKLDLTESKQDILIVVKSSIGNKEMISETEEDPPISPKVTILVSPKNINEVSSHGNDTIKAIYHAENIEPSSIDIQLPIDKERIDTLSGGDRNTEIEYPDDFSADVDNYNSQSEYGNNSPISVLKTSEDENFWDS